MIRHIGREIKPDRWAGLKRGPETVAEPPSDVVRKSTPPVSKTVPTLAAGVSLALSSLAGGGCLDTLENTGRRAVTFRQGVPVDRGETAAEVEEKWGPPARRSSYEGPAGTAVESLWEYDQYDDLNQAIVTTTVRFEGGRVVSVERRVTDRTEQYFPPD